MPRKIYNEDEEKTIKEAKQRLEGINKSLFREKGVRTPTGKNPQCTFHDVILNMHFEMGQKVRFIGCCPYNKETPLDHISGLHVDGFSSPEQLMKEINGHYFGKRCVILNISEKTTDNLTYFKCQFKDGTLFTCLPFEVSKLFSEVDNICQTCHTKYVGDCRGWNFGIQI